jgi:hypothetical protein
VSDHDSIFSVIQSHPGCSRDDVRKHLTVPISERELTNALTRLRRQGRIQNQGTRKNPIWYINKVKKPESRPGDSWEEIREAARKWSSRGGLDEPIDVLIERYGRAIGREQ